MPEQTPFDRAVRDWWDGPGLVADLRAAEWHESEPTRMDRRVYVGSYLFFEGLTKQAVPKEEWNEAVGNGFEHEIVDEYEDALAAWMIELMGEHVYVEDYEGDVFVGQYMETEDLEKPSVPGVLDWMPPEE